MVLKAFPKTRQLFLKGLLGLALLPLFPISCQRRAPQAPAPPPPTPTDLAPNDLQLGDRYFEEGDYPNAVTAYTAYLRQNPTGAGREQALFRLGLSLALPANPARDPGQAIAYLNELASSFPNSPLRPQAELVVQLQEQIQQLRVGIEASEQQVGALSQQLQQLKQSEGELEQLRSDLSAREERIRQLTRELERLKAIDMQRRPANPPPR